MNQTEEVLKYLKAGHAILWTGWNWLVVMEDGSWVSLTVLGLEEAEIQAAE